MKHRFLLHSVNHTPVVVDITQFGLPSKVFPATGENTTIPARRFQAWKDAEEYLLRLGADARALGRALEQLEQAGVSMLTISQ